jgi:tRNA dimethylallyltransferase
MMSMGYRQWRDCLEGAVDIETVTDEWKKEERKYSRRQLVWWKPDVRINWFNITDPVYKKKVENMIEKWYDKDNLDA